ncbi:MAG: Na+/H+ antiporter NhaA [Gammaproteobacteria bacterium]|nr:Na+/H+ antiporter NhaA [Gammaproteobacteria bacterium]
MLRAINEFLRLESAGGILLVGAAIAAMILANSPLAAGYQWILDMPVEIRVGPLQIAKPLLLWVNDGLMAVFFFLVGLELKREAIEGELSKPANIVLPAVGAVGGMLVPALIYAAINHGDAVALAGWAIPAATDIAFALGILTLLGKRIPTALKVFLVSLAIFDDIGAIIIIALFYTDGLSTSALAVAAVALVALTVFNRRHVSSMPPYIFVGLVLWVALLKSGVHATLAGVALAMFIPMRDRERPEHSPLRDLEHELHPVVAFVILPIFAFANSGIGLTGMSADFFLHPVSLGVAGGLFIGKQIGVFLFCWLTIRLGLAQLPRDVGWLGLYGAALLCGVGFTMSLFIGSLAFENVGARVFDERIGIVLGSLLSGIAGYVVLKTVCRGEGTCR